jgi:hypothetical protein
MSSLSLPFDELFALPVEIRLRNGTFDLESLQNHRTARASHSASASVSFPMSYQAQHADHSTKGRGCIPTIRFIFKWNMTMQVPCCASGLRSPNAFPSQEIATTESQSDTVRIAHPPSIRYSRNIQITPSYIQKIQELPLPQVVNEETEMHSHFQDIYPRHSISTHFHPVQRSRFASINSKFTFCLSRRVI